MLGILFWSTFSTSFLFYLFVISVLLTTPLAVVFQVVRSQLDFEKEPIVGLTVSLLVVELLFFLVSPLL